METRIFPGTVLPWRPTMLANLGLFLRADIGRTMNGGDVAAWMDQAVGMSLAQANAAKQPAYNATGGPNSKPAVVFSQANNDTLISAGNVTRAAAQLHWAVIKKAVAAVDDTLSSGTASTNMPELARSSKLSWFSSSGAVDSLVATQSGDQVLAWHARVNTVTFYVNWSQVAEKTIGGAVTSPGNDTLWLCSNQDLGGWTDVAISEYGIMNASPSAKDLANLAAYTMMRYGL